MGKYKIKDLCLLGYNAVQSGAYRLLHVGFLLGLLFDGGDMFLRNVG
jgi:hypothetical protein